MVGNHPTIGQGPVLGLLHLSETPISEFLIRHFVVQEFSQPPEIHEDREHRIFVLVVYGEFDLLDLREELLNIGIT